jgi:hypothetical protein
MNAVAATKLADLAPGPWDFGRLLQARGIDLPPLSIETLQANITKLCNQSCRHCHVDSSPARTEKLSREGIEMLVRILAAHPQIAKLDITGGAPELHPDFDWLVVEAVKLGKHVMSRHNLTVQFDGNPVTKESKAYLPEFYAQHRVEVISSLPYYRTTRNISPTASAARACSARASRPCGGSTPSATGATARGWRSTSSTTRSGLTCRRRRRRSRRTTSAN